MVDATDLKSVALVGVRVRVPPSALVSLVVCTLCPYFAFSQ